MSFNWFSKSVNLFVCNSSNALLYYYVDAVFYNSLLNFCPSFGTFFYAILITSSLKVFTISSNIFVSGFSNVLFKVGFYNFSLSVF